MEIEDFLPKYPFAEESAYEVLNPYKDSLGEVLYHKKEFYENRLPVAEDFPQDKGSLTRNQKTIARLMSTYTPYDALLLVHSMGTGKTCSSIGAVEQIRKENSTIQGAMVLAKGETILDNFLSELAYKCTAGEYLPPNINTLTEREARGRIKKKAEFYSFNTFVKLAKRLKTMTDSQVEREFSNLVIIIDEVHNLRDQEDEDMKDAYPQYHRMLHLVTNCKVLLLSGTPMKDTPEEIASILNLILPEKDQFPVGKEFIENFLEKSKDGRMVVKGDKIGELKEKMKGRVSFLREAQSAVARRYIGKFKVGSLKHFVVNPLIMSEFQTKGYVEAYNRDKGLVEEEKNKKKAIYNNSREASLFVYPDGSYGRTGFEKYIAISESKILQQEEVKAYKMNKDLTTSVQGKTTEESIQKIRKYSASYADTIERILQTKGCCFVFSTSVTGSGAILFSLLLEKIGFTKATGNEQSKGMRYIILTNKTATSVENRRLVASFNDPRNIHGEYIQVIIGSRAVSEGFSFQNILFEAILTPHWNYSETSQAIARGIRFGSHDQLVRKGINPVVDIVQQVSLPATEVPSLDLLKYEISEDKDINIRYMMRLLMESAIDCALNYKRNYISGFDRQRECDYMACDYVCDEVNVQDLADDQLDYSTYQLYYAKPMSIELRKKVEELFRTNPVLDLSSVVNNLKHLYSEDEIINALYRLTHDQQTFSYKTFLKYYGESSVQKIMGDLEDMFRVEFRIDLETIMERLGKKYRLMEVVMTLDTLINEQRMIKNKYGFPCYVREEKNVYFLVTSLSEEAQLFSAYYTKYPSIHKKATFEEVASKLTEQAIPKVIEKLFESNDETQLKKLLSTIQPEVQALLIESVIYAENQKIQEKVMVRRMLLDYYKSYIKQIGNTSVSTYANKLRCLEHDSKWDGWKDCSPDISNRLEQQQKERTDQMRQNPYGLFGKENPENKKFCLIDVQKEQKAVQKANKEVEDKRITYTGKVCSEGGFNVVDLLNMVIKRVKITAPTTFLSNVGIEGLRKRLTDDLKDPKTKLKDLYKLEEVTTLTEPELRSALYWGTKKEGGVRGLDTLCKGLRDWLDQHGLLEVDNQCGVQGKRKEKEVAVKTKKETVKKRIFRIETYLAKDEKLKPFFKKINEMMTICFEEPYKLNNKLNNTWILVISGKKTIAGVLMMDENNYIWNVCVAPKFRNQGVARQAITEAVGNICILKGNPPTLLVDNKGVNKERLLGMYEAFGFNIVQADDKYTYLRHSC